MMIHTPSRPRPSFGRGARERLFCALIAGAACFVVACGDDDPAQQTGVGGSGGIELDASVRDLPGDGLEPTPESDIDARQRNPIGPEQLNDALDGLRNGGGQGGSGGGLDAGPDTGSNAPDGGAS
ncbi:MAG TPA: hypothetical protein VMG12_07800 [Polyangiaceae bacterium]|nr:hypothetical protein [Polyangiaceae bacterium]